MDGKHSVQGQALPTHGGLQLSLSPSPLPAGQRIPGGQIFKLRLSQSIIVPQDEPRPGGRRNGMPLGSGASPAVRWTAQVRLADSEGAELGLGGQVVRGLGVKGGEEADAGGGRQRPRVWPRTGLDRGMRGRTKSERTSFPFLPTHPSCSREPAEQPPGMDASNLQGWMPRTLDIYRLPGLFKAS